MQAVAAAPKAFGATAFWKEEFETHFRFIYFKTCSWIDAQSLSKRFLTRNELVDS